MVDESACLKSRKDAEWTSASGVYPYTAAIRNIIPSSMDRNSGSTAKPSSNPFSQPYFPLFSYGASARPSLPLPSLRRPRPIPMQPKCRWTRGRPQPRNRTGPHPAPIRRKPHTEQMPRPQAPSLQERALLAYSLRSASTGSRREAAEEGINPATNVSSTLIPIRTTAASHGRLMMSDTR